jgi:IclR family acetate operon transcriptional repressor
MRTLNRALDILEVFLKIGDDNIRLSELAKLSGLNKATVNRIVSDLVNRGYLKQPKPRGKYYLGAKFIRFNHLIMVKNRLAIVAPPYLAKLAESVKDCVLLTVLDGEHALVSDAIDSQHVLRTSLEVSTQIPLYCTGQGKAILAGMTEAELDEYLSKVTLKQFTENTITDPSELKSHLIIVAKEGIAYDDEDQFMGIRNVAAGIRKADGKVIAAVGVIGPSVRMTRARMREITPQVKLCAAEISRALGYVSCDTEPTVSKPKAKKQKVAIT